MLPRLPEIISFPRKFQVNTGSKHNKNLKTVSMYVTARVFISTELYRFNLIIFTVNKATISIS